MKIILNILTLGIPVIFNFIRRVDKLENEFSGYKEFSTKQKDRIENDVKELRREMNKNFTKVFEILVKEK